jgi:DNA-binding LacI/PurR family transcriptional regulator
MNNPVPNHPTMEDVARAAGVSRALVSLVFRQSPKVSAARRDRVLEAAERLGYRPNAMARHLASRTTRTLGVLLNDLHNPFFADIYDGVETAATSLGYRLLLTAGRHRDGSEHDAIDTMLQHRVDAMILISPRIPAADIVSFSRQAPLVVLGRIVDGAAIDSIMADEGQGALAAVQHLATLGHRSIVHIDGGRGAGASARRVGFEQAITQLGLGEPDIVAGDFTEMSGVTATAGLLQRTSMPTAIFAANDIVALGVIDTLAGAGLRVPEDVSVLGYDNTALARMRHISLTTVDQPRREMGEMAVHLLDQRVDARRATPVTHLMRPTLMTRRSTASPREV